MDPIKQQPIPGPATESPLPDATGQVIPPKQAMVCEEAYHIEVLRAHADFAIIKAFLANPEKEKLKFAGFDLKDDPAFASLCQKGPEEILQAVQQLRAQLKPLVDDNNYSRPMALDNLNQAKEVEASTRASNTRVAMITLLIVAFLIVALVIGGKQLDFSPSQYTGGAMIIIAFPLTVFGIRKAIGKAQQEEIKKLKQEHTNAENLHNDYRAIYDRLREIEEKFKN